MSIGILAFHGHVVDLRSDAKCRVARQRPRRGRPGEHKDLKVLKILQVLQEELRRARRVLHVAVAAGLVELVRREARAGSGRVGLDSITLVQIALLVELLEQVPQCLDVLVVVGDVRVVQVHPVAHLLGERSPLLGVFHHLAAALRVIFVHADFLADVLLGDAKFLLHTQLYRQTMRVPSCLAAHLKALHGLESTESVFDGAGQHMMDARHAVC